MSTQTNTPDNIVFFDGVCGLCNSSVDVLLRKDKKRVLLFAPLQGTTASRLLPAEDLTTLNTFIFFSQGKIWRRSDAVLRVLWTLGGFWKLTAIARIIPGFLRNALYNFIATNRYRWFGKKESCRLPTKEERSQFLD